MFILSAHQQSFPALCAKKVIVIVAHNYANEKTFHKNHYVYFAEKSDGAAPDPGARGNKKTPLRPIPSYRDESGVWKGNHILIELPQGGAKLIVGGCILAPRGVQKVCFLAGGCRSLKPLIIQQTARAVSCCSRRLL